MAVNLHRLLLGALGPALVLLGTSVTFAQQPEYYVAAAPEQQAAPYYGPPAPMTYEQRLADQDARIAQLEAQLHQQFQRAQVPAQPVAATMADAPPANDLGACKEVELITKPVMKVGGRLYFDVVCFEDTTGSPVFDSIDRQNEAGFSYARINWSGYVYENVYGIMEIDFADDVRFKDTYIEAQNLPILGRFRAGFFKEPISLEDNMSDNVTTFMNRSLAIRAFSYSRRIGCMAYDYFNENPNTGWFVGTFARDFNATDGVATLGTQAQDAGDWTFDGRLVYLPIYDEPSDGRYLVHLGSSYTYRRTGSAGVSFTARSELGLRNTTSWLNTGTITDRDYNQVGLEFLTIWGPASVQSEVFVAALDSNDECTGGYVAFTYSLTGENRGYKREDKTASGIKPYEDFFRVSTADGVCMGSGAWELAARWSFVDLEVGPGTNLGGGVNTLGYENSYTLGANWYWNPQTRMMFDVIWENVHRTTGASATLPAAGMRWQINF